MEPNKVGSSFSSPSLEYIRYKGLNKPQDVESQENVHNRDLLVAFLLAADAMFDELCRIREALETRKG